jgi:hypothetical protein
MRDMLVFVTRPHLSDGRGEESAATKLLFRPLAVAVLVSLLALALTACEGGYTTRGERTTMSQLGDRGEVDVHMDSANGSIAEDIEFDCADCIVEVEVTLQVEQGTFKLEFLGEDEKVTLVLEASSGEQVSGSGYMVTDSFGEGEYRVTADEAQDISYHITYRIR